MIQFILSASVIIIVGSYLVKFSEQIAEVTNLGRLFVGSLFLAGATSLPELMVDISAVKNNMPNLAVGDLIGSSLFNLLILGIADLLHKGTASIFSKTSAAHALSASMSITVTSIAGIAIFLGGQFPQFSIAGLGMGTIAILVAYVLGLRIVYFDQKIVFVKDSNQKIKQETSLPKAITGYAICAIAILITAPYLANAAGEIADLSGLGKTFVGTTLVAFSTSLPELVSTITSVRKGYFDLALGNIFGSNAFNMVLLAPLDCIFEGPLLASVSVIHTFTCFSTILITSIAVMGQLYQIEKRKKFIEPDAFAVIFLVIFSLIILYYAK